MVDPQRVLELLRKQASGPEPWAPTAHWVGEVLGCGELNAGIALVKLKEDGEVRRWGGGGWMPVWSAQGRVQSFALVEAPPVTEDELDRRARALGDKPHRRTMRYFLSSPEAWASMERVHGAQACARLLAHFADGGLDRGVAIEAVACACRSHRRWVALVPNDAARRMATLSGIALATRGVGEHALERLERWVAAALDVGFTLEVSPPHEIYGVSVVLRRDGVEVGRGWGNASSSLILRALATVQGQSPPQALARVDQGLCRG